MKKILAQALIIIVVFFTMWFLLMQIDWLGVFNIQKTTPKTEEKRVDVVREFIQQSEKECTDHFAWLSVGGNATAFSLQ